MYQLCFYVTESSLEAVKEAIFSAGGGRYGSFNRCAWETLGSGQYETQGEELVKQAEYRVEILCQKACLSSVIKSLKDTHPCKNPAFYVTKIEFSEVF